MKSVPRMALISRVLPAPASVAAASSDRHRSSEEHRGRSPHKTSSERKGVGSPFAVSRKKRSSPSLLLSVGGSSPEDFTGVHVCCCLLPAPLLSGSAPSCQPAPPAHCERAHPPTPSSVIDSCRADLCSSSNTQVSYGPLQR